MIYETNRYIFNFQQFENLRFSGENIFNCEIIPNVADKQEAIY